MRSKRLLLVATVFIIVFKLLRGQRSLPRRAVPPSTAGTPSGEPRRGASRSSRTRVRLLAVAAIAGISIAQWVVFRPVGAGGNPPLRLTHLQAVAQQGSLTVTARITNGGTKFRSARVWWLLAPPGPEAEWTRRAYQSEVRGTRVGPRASMTFHWREPVAVPTGTYVVSAWVHAEQDGHFDHSDGKVAGTVHLLPSEPLLRHAPPALGVAIVGAKGTVRHGSPGEVTATLSLKNSTPEFRRLQARWDLMPILTAVPPDWWRRPPIHRGEPHPVVLRPGESATVQVGGRAQVRPGRYALRLMLESAGAEVGGFLDEVLVPEVQTEPPSRERGALRDSSSESQGQPQQSVPARGEP